MKTDITLLWNALGGLAWLDLGNGWRNLYLLSCALTALALGVLFVRRRWFVKHSPTACFLTGMAATPLVQYLWTLLLAAVWPQAPRLVYIGVLPALSALYLLGVLIRHRKSLRLALGKGWAFLKRVCTFDKPALVSLCFALAMALLLTPVCVRLCGSMNAAGAGDSGEYMALALRYCEDRSLENLLSKEDLEGHFRGNNHFPSMELFMVHGLMHTGGEYGYPNDKPMLFGVGLLTFYMVAAFGALLLVLCRQQKRWVLLGALLLNLVPNLFFSVNGAPRDIWRILALFWAMLYFAGLRPGGPWPSYLTRLLVTLLVCFTVMSTHVVCFVVLPFIVVAWVLWRWYGAALAGGHALRELLGSVGLALGAAVGTIAGFGGNLWCYWRWGEVSPWRLMTTYTDAPWYTLYMQTEYKLEETTTHVSFLQGYKDILMDYATPIGLWGLRLALAGLVCALIYLIWRRASGKRVITASGVLAPSATREGQQAAGAVMLSALLTLCTLAPMSGLLDSPLYSFSGSFLALQRYTLQWFMLATVMIAAALASLETAWPAVLGWLHRRFSRSYAALLKKPWWKSLRGGATSAMALLCSLLCIWAFWQGIQQTGYSKTFYRYSRNVLEDEATLLDNGFLQRYALLMTAEKHVPGNEKILLTRMGYQYPLRARGYILTSNPIVPLMNLPLEEVEEALRKMNVALLATEADFWDERYFALSTLSDYLNALPAGQILEDGDMRLYVLDSALAQEISAEWAEAKQAVERAKGR